MPAHNIRERKTVLVTRPKHQAEPLCVKLVAHGFHPIRFPAMEIVPAQKPSTVTSHDAFIFTSANAVFDSVDLLEPLKRENKIIIAMGRGTKEALARFGVDEVLMPKGAATSEEMHDFVRAFVKLSQSILILTGVGGRGLLAKSLKVLHSVDVCEVYERVLPKTMPPESLIKDWCGARFSFSLITSQQTLEHLLCLVPMKYHAFLMANPMIVPSARVQDIALQRGFNSVHLAHSALDEAMLASLLDVSQNLLQCSNA